MTSVELLASTLATWRVTHLLFDEMGPWSLVERLRRAISRIGGKPLIDCFLCLSIWMAIPFALLMTATWREFALALPALSGGAILLDRLTSSAQLERFVNETMHPPR